MSQRRLLPLVLAAAALLLVVLALSKMFGDRSARAAARPEDPAAASTGASGEEGAPEAEAQEGEDDLAPLRRQSVLVYFPAIESDGLVGEEREIFGTAAPGDRVKQILSDMLAGPTGPAAVRAVPPGTQLRQVYVLDNGVAYLDFSAALKQGLSGGSQSELLTVYAIVNSVAMNVPEIRRVGILVEGLPVDTLNGHLDLRRPLPPDPSWLLKAEEGQEAAMLVQAERK